LLPAAGETVKPKVAAINEIKKLQTEAAKPDAGEPVIKTWNQNKGGQHRH